MGCEVKVSFQNNCSEQTLMVDHVRNTLYENNFFKKTRS